MVGKIINKKVTGVKSAKEAAGVEGAKAVTGVGEVKATNAVGGVRGVGGIPGKLRATRVMTREERQQLLNLIQEEADKLFDDGSLPQSQREVAKNAVIMAVDAGIIVEDPDERPDGGTTGKKG